MPADNKTTYKHTIGLNINTSDPIYVSDLGCEKCKPSHFFGPAIRKNYLIHLVLSGKGCVERNGSITHLCAGDAFVIKPDEVVTYRADENEPWYYYWIEFGGAHSATIMKQTTDNLFPKYKKSGIISLKTCIENGVIDTIGLLETLFAVLNAIKSTKTVAPRDFVDSALTYIEHNYFREFDITLLAKTLGVSRSHFTTTFTSRVGITPHSYLTKIRIDKAKEYLTTTSLSVTEIAYSVGFASLERFSESFKNHTSLSPLQFRKSSI